MRRFLTSRFALLFACYMTGWLCVSPSLVLCVCVDHEATITARTHETPACSHDHSDHSHHAHPASPATDESNGSPDLHESPDSHKSHDSDDHSDRPLFDSLTRGDQPVTFTLDLTPVSVIDWDLTASAVSSAFDRTVTPHVHGPPRAIDLSLRSIILLT